MKRNRIVDKALVVSDGLLMLTLMMGALLAGEVVRADDSSVVQTSIIVPVACTLRGTGTDSHTATLAPNTYSGASGSEYENGIGKTTLTAICNDDNGFSIYAIGYTGNSYDSENHTKLVGNSLGGTIATKAYASGDTTSNWSMKLTKVTDSTVSYNPTNLTISTGYDAWHAIPDTYTKVAQYKANTGSSTTDTTLGVKLETTYATFIASNQPADTYVGQVKYTMVHPYAEEPLQPQPAVAGKIVYHKNAGNAVGTMGDQPASDGNEVTLYASNYSRAGYGFAGWSNKFDYATNTDADLKFYGPNETITVPAGTTANGLSLYAIWIKPEGDMQDLEKVAALCGTGSSSLTQDPMDGTADLSSVTALTDRRDGQVYAIAKLADGNCWTIENLRLENTAAGNTDGSLAQGYDASFIGLAAPEFADFVESTTTNSLYSIDGSTDAIISGSHQGFRFPRYNNSNTNNRGVSTTNVAENIYSYGNYYTWNAAIADTNEYFFGGDYGTTSICPTGWRLPIGVQSTTDKSFGKLSVSLGGPADGAVSYPGSTPTGNEMSRILRRYPNNYLYSGYFDDSSISVRGSYGAYWSSSAVNYGVAYRLSLSTSRVEPGPSNMSRHKGITVRCVENGL